MSMSYTPVVKEMNMYTIMIFTKSQENMKNPHYKSEGLSLVWYEHVFFKLSPIFLGRNPK